MKQNERVLPKYCENIIVAAVYKRHFDWYVSPKDLWKMDYRKLYSAIAECFAKLGRSADDFYKTAGSFETFCEKRNGIEILDSDSAGKFFSQLINCRYTAEEISCLRAVTPDSDSAAFKPSLFVNFDTKELYSCYPESEGFEKFVPEGWAGIYGDFTSLIPADKRFRE